MIELVLSITYFNNIFCKIACIKMVTFKLCIIIDILYIILLNCKIMWLTYQNNKIKLYTKSCYLTILLKCR